MVYFQLSYNTLLSAGLPLSSAVLSALMTYFKSAYKIRYRLLGNNWVEDNNVYMDMYSRTMGGVQIHDRLPVVR